MAITIASIGDSTLPTNDNAISTVTIIDSSASTGDTIILTPTSALPKDLKYEHTLYVSAIDNGVSFTVTSSQKDLPSDITFGYVIFTGTA